MYTLFSYLGRSVLKARLLICVSFEYIISRRRTSLASMVAQWITPDPVSINCFILAPGIEGRMYRLIKITYVLLNPKYSHGLKRMPLCFYTRSLFASALGGLCEQCIAENLFVSLLKAGLVCTDIIAVSPVCLLATQVHSLELCLKPR